MRLGRARLVVVELVRLDADSDDVARIDVHAVREGRIEQLV